MKTLPKANPIVMFQIALGRYNRLIAMRAPKFILEKSKAHVIKRFLELPLDNNSAIG
jgi:hypothetical protein